MINLKLEIRISNDTDVDIKFSPSSFVTYTIYCDIDELLGYYDIQADQIEEISPALVRKMISDDRFHIVKETFYNSSVKSFTNKSKTIAFQMEDNLVHARRLKDGAEIFFPYIEGLRDFTINDFEEGLISREKVTPLTTRIETAESDFGFNQ